MSTTSSDRENSDTETSPRETDTGSSEPETGSDYIPSEPENDSNGGYATDDSQAVDVQAYDSNDSIGSGNEDWEESSVASAGYGGRGEPEIVNNMEYVIGDIIEFEFGGKLFSGEILAIADKLLVRHLDQKNFDKRKQYNAKDLITPPNWVSVQTEMRTGNIPNFSGLKLAQHVYWISNDVDDDMNPIERRGTIKYIDEMDERVIIERQSGPAKMDYGDEKEILTPEDFERGRNFEDWDWAQFSYIQEILLPPANFIGKGSISWSSARKDIEEYPFTGDKPGFRPGMDLGPTASDFAWIKQILTPEHVETFWLPPTNAEGARMKKLADDRYKWTSVEYPELFGPDCKGRDSKWRRWKPMTLDHFYAFWTAKLTMAVYGWNLESFFSRTSFSNIARKGQPLFG